MLDHGPLRETNHKGAEKICAWGRPRFASIAPLSPNTQIRHGTMLDALEYRISCSSCGHVLHMRVGWLLEHPAFPCPQGCGATIASPLAELSELVPIPLSSADTIDLSAWSPKRGKKPAKAGASRRKPKAGGRGKGNT